jgi:predicted DNA-binding protein with PD1-like motif
VRFAHGDDIVGGLHAFAREHEIAGAWVNLLGAIEDPELGYYDLPTRSYTRRSFPGDWEIMGAVGNLGWLGETPVLHVHVTISGPDFAAKGGHLFAGKAGATCEVWLRDLGTKLERARDESIGLALWHLE